MGPGQRNQDFIRKRVETLEETKMASNGFNEPPSFISDEKSMAEYEEDVLMWSRLTTLQPEVHAEAIVFHLGKQKHPIKEKIMTAIGSKINYHLFHPGKGVPGGGLGLHRVCLPKHTP